MTPPSRYYTTAYYLNPELIAWVRNEAARRHITNSQVIRELIVTAMHAQKAA